MLMCVFVSDKASGNGIRICAAALSVGRSWLNPKSACAPQCVCMHIYVEAICCVLI